MFRVSADVLHLDGVLAGIVSPAGFSLTVPSRDRAEAMACWINNGPTVQQVGGGRYQFVSPASIVNFGEVS